MKYLVGVDVGGTTVKLGIFPEEGDVLYKWEIPTKKKEEADQLWASIAEGIREKFAEEGLSMKDLLSVGIDIPGPVRSDGFLPHLVNIGVTACYPGAELSKCLDWIPVAACNDANAAALGEMAYGAARGYKDVALITLGTGVGGGIIVDGKLVAGNRGVAGEIGHFVVNPDETERCNCGNYGCMEQYASATGIVRIAKKYLAEENSISSLRALPEEKLSAHVICDAARDGDPLALHVMDTYGKYLGIAVSHIYLTFDPDIVVIGGGVSAAGDVVIKPLEKYLVEYTHIATEKCKIVLAELGNDAGIYGAAALAKTALHKQA